MFLRLLPSKSKTTESRSLAAKCAKSNLAFSRYFGRLAAAATELGQRQRTSWRKDRQTQKSHWQAREAAGDSVFIAGFQIAAHRGSRVSGHRGWPMRCCQELIAVFAIDFPSERPIVPSRSSRSGLLPALALPFKRPAARPWAASNPFAVRCERGAAAHSLSRRMQLGIFRR
jgi:hypothetical protein